MTEHLAQQALQAPTVLQVLTAPTAPMEQMDKTLMQHSPSS